MKRSEAHKTAISRSIASAPCSWLNKQGLLKGRLLDYGCGRGKDADRFDMERYDPHFAPDLPEGKFDTITCTYVLNVVDAFERARIIGRVKDLLKPGGTAYFAVRRDLPRKPGPQHMAGGTIQYWVEMPGVPIREIRSRYAIYKLEKDNG